MSELEELLDDKSVTLESVVVERESLAILADFSRMFIAFYICWIPGLKGRKIASAFLQVAKHVDYKEIMVKTNKIEEEEALGDTRE